LIRFVGVWKEKSMNGHFVRVSLLVCSILFASRSLSAQTLDAVSANDNRVPAGTLRDGVLTLRLELRTALWHPEGETGEAIRVYAFGEVGRPLQAPAPLIRVPQGTVIELSITSTLGVPTTLYGLHERPGSATDAITLPAGGTQRTRFVAGAPGTYLYYARTPDGARGNGRGLDALLGGALVVDAPGAPTDDRIFVLERWGGATRTAMNGKSWPFTERLGYRAGEPVRWRVVNASDLSHPMHLHGLHFNVDGVGDGERYRAFSSDERPLVFTHTAEILETFEMTWVPQESGRWLFHCHRQPHMRIPVDPGAADVVVADDHAHAHQDPAYAGMGGMIMEITVTGGAHAETPESVWASARKLELDVAAQDGDARFYRLTLREPGVQQGGGGRGQGAGRGLSGPPIVLEQGKPVEIKVVNNLAEETAIHWHGMELESYYDGVPLIGGEDAQIAPSVKAGGTFVARMIPSRAGTFIYHTHWHDDTQLTGGVHGPLIVVPAGQAHDPATDRAFLFSQSPGDPFGAAMLLMNGVPQPNTIQLRTGTTYRFRFINITPSVANLRVSLRKSGEPVRWRALARDAADLPPAQATMRPAELQISVGETFDFEYTASSPEELTLEGIQPNDTRRVVQTLVFSNPPR
jgi:FtsP/CotA-like multicopper oxidase with cupredoxin domain